MLLGGRGVDVFGGLRGGTYVESDNGHEPIQRKAASALTVGYGVKPRVHSQPDIDLSQGLAEPVGPLGRGLLQVLLGAVQRLEQGNYVALVRLLGGGEARLVHAVVDLVVLPLVGLVDLRAESLWVELDLAVLFVDEAVELFPRALSIFSRS